MHEKRVEQFEQQVDAVELIHQTHGQRDDAVVIAVKNQSDVDQQNVFHTSHEATQLPQSNHLQNRITCRPPPVICEWLQHNTTTTPTLGQHHNRHNTNASTTSFTNTTPTQTNTIPTAH
jgi:hypothetical protein